MLPIITSYRITDEIKDKLKKQNVKIGNRKSRQ